MSTQEHKFLVTVSGCTAEQADQVMGERIGYDEDYGFSYTLSAEEMCQQAGRVDETEVERVAKALFDGEQASRNGGWQWSECSSIEVEGWKDLARSAIAALAQNTQGDGGIEIVVDSDRVMHFKESMNPRLASGKYKLYLHAERARVPDGMVLVPREPTQEMEAAGANALDAWLHAAVPTGDAPDGKSVQAWQWQAMIAAAPSQPKDAGEVGEPTDDRILWGVVANAGRLASVRQQRWVHVMDNTGLGSQASIALCRRFNFDPDEDCGEFPEPPEEDL